MAGKIAEPTKIETLKTKTKIKRKNTQSYNMCYSGLNGLFGIHVACALHLTQKLSMLSWTFRGTERAYYIQWSLSCVMVIELNFTLRRYTNVCVRLMNFDGFKNIYLSLIAGNMSIASRIFYRLQTNEKFITILRACVCVYVCIEVKRGRERK